MSVQLDNASARQRRASDPTLSAWVSANAGSGKTHVLALRVVRLLLAGAAPSKILCLTFTKAAAANMAERVFDRLSQWTQFDDAELAADIVAAGAPRPDAADLEAARKLFAQVLETPGGLKIQTIHAFCERVLHLFPFEANVPAAFRALDERDAAVLRELSQARLFAGAERDAALSEAIARVAAAVGQEEFGPLIAETARLADDLAAHGLPDAFAQKLSLRLGFAAGEDEAGIAHAMLGGGAAVWKRWAQALNQGSTNDRKLADLLNAAAVLPDGDMRLALYLSVFLTEKQTPRKTLATRTTTERFPDIVDALYQERDRLFALLDKKRAAAAVARSRDLYLISRACEAAYKRAKAARSALDFDDLIAKTQKLFERGDAAWVLFKLDRGVEHILVDEAQDTSRAQWSILAKLAEDFLSGAGAGAQGRTFFAVGDEKQSIFSFQGAEPHLFDEQRRFFSRAHANAKLPFVEQPLIHSFRSSPAVLDAIDKVFGVAEVWRGVSAAEPSAPPHAAIRDFPGLVEIWPILTLDPPPEPGEWRLPLDAQKLTHPANVLADRIAEQIARWTAPGSPERIVDPQTRVLRPIRPGDVLILVRSRGALFEALTPALRRRRVPAAGADRLTLAAHIAVLDLCAAARAALNPDDDLVLAAVLKSPLIGLDDDALIRLCPSRPGPLSAALAADPAFAVAQRKVANWRARAGLGAFDFFARLLGAEGGRRALVGRLGPEAGDVIDEFLARALARERGEAPSLTRFLEEIGAADSQIKRDMEAGGDRVRTMTVHAAKGLEAPIVFLPDTGGAPTGRHDPKWLRLPALAGAPPLFVWAATAADDSEAMAGARAVAREAAAGEHRRLLYVAMTRAAQRLVVAGFRGAREPPPDNWASLIAAGIAPHTEAVDSWWSPTETILRLGQGAVGVGTAASTPPSAPPPLPVWASAAAPREIVFATAAPARRVAGDVGPERLARLEEGRLAHKLMQSLPALPPERRRASAQAYLARSAYARADLAERLLALIETPALAPLFGAGSRGEVSFAATLAGAWVEGRIDRLAWVGDEVWIADFKTGGAVVRAEYRRQLALYRAATEAMFPGRKIRAFLLWIDTAKSEELDASTLDDAFLDWARGQQAETSPS